MSRIRDLHAGWMTDPVYRKAFDDLEEEFSLAAALTRARAATGLMDEIPNVFRPLTPTYWVMKAAIDPGIISQAIVQPINR